MNDREKYVIFWLLVAALGCALLFSVRGILLPFVAGAAIAYFLDPVADRLEKIGFSRLWATVLILSIFAICTFLLLVTLVPFLVRECREIITELPATVQTLRQFLSEVYQNITGKELKMDGFDLEKTLKEASEQSSMELTSLLRGLWDGGLALVTSLSLLIVTPVVAFYLLLDWDRMVTLIDSWLPRAHVSTIRGLAVKINQTLNGFVRGQLTVCFLLACFYSIGLLAVGLKYGLLIGVTAGFLSFIPYLGSAIGLLLSTAMAISQFWPDWPSIAMVLGVFIAGQVIEGNLLQPKIVGDQVNLHPVWLIFALFVFGYLMGFVGMLVAVPLAATIGVLVRFFLGQYLESELYKGAGNAPSQDLAK